MSISGENKSSKDYCYKCEYYSEGVNYCFKLFKNIQFAECGGQHFEKSRDGFFDYIDSIKLAENIPNDGTVFFSQQEAVILINEISQYYIDVLDKRYSGPEKQRVTKGIKRDLLALGFIWMNISDNKNERMEMLNDHLKFTKNHLIDLLISYPDENEEPELFNLLWGSKNVLSFPNIFVCYVLLPDLIRKKLEIEKDYQLFYVECANILQILSLEDQISDLSSKKYDETLKLMIEKSVSKSSIKKFKSDNKNRFIKIFPSPSNLSWKEVTITFISNESIKICARGVTAKVTYPELGFTDGRIGDKPNTRWAFLRKLAELKGELSWESDVDQKTKSRAKAVVKDIRKKLKIIMQIDDDPFYLYRKVKAYKIKFKLIDQRYGK